MTNKNEAGTLLPMTVTEGVTVYVLPSEAHEYVMTTAEVAKGYGVSDRVIRKHKIEHADELIKDKHFVTAVESAGGTNSTSQNLPIKRTYWTKRGVVHLGFFVHSELAKQFRSAAEDLIIEKLEPLAPPSGYGELVSLIDRAAPILGSQDRLARRLGLSNSVFSHARTMPELISDFRKRQIAAFCRKVIAEGAGYLPDARAAEPCGVDMSDILVDVCRIEDTELRLSLLDKLTGGGSHGTV